MDVTHCVEEVEKYIDSFKLQIEDEKKEIVDSQKRFSNLQTAFSQKAPSNSVLNSLFKDEEPSGFNFSKSEEKRKQLGEQRKAEYNSYLEKKENELLSKKRAHKERNVTPKSILDSVDYDQVLAKRKEEEAQFRNINRADVPHSTKPTVNENIKKPDFDSISTLENGQSIPRNNNVKYSTVSLPGSTMGIEDLSSNILLAEHRKKLADLEAENARLLEERIAKQLEEQRRQMLAEFENELRKNNQIREEIQNLQSTANSVHSSPKRLSPKTEEYPYFAKTGGGGDPVRRVTPKTEEYPHFGRTGGGGDPVRDAYGNLITVRGAKNQINADKSILSFPSMQQQPMKDRMALYREELQRQIEEKKRLDALERAKAREVEDKIAQRIEEQRLQMQKEYEKELQKNNKIKEGFQRQQERLRQLEEFQRKDAEERRRKQMEAKPPDTENISPNTIVMERSQSPPIPAVRTKALLEKALPATAEVKPENVFSSLAEIRRKIMEEQQKPKNDFKNSYEVMNRRTVQEVSDDDDDDFLQSSFKSST